ncbi:MAG: RHS repeat-associated core domain-containing protein [Pseudomonadota bacterium]
MPLTLQAGTTTSSYSYNTDGTLTAITVEEGEGTTETSYLTWDNITPNAGNPTTGTLRAGNGRLRAIGPHPGIADQFTFDARDHLMGYTPPSGGAAPEYGYGADGTLATTQADGDTVAFYRSVSPHPQIINQVQPSTDLVSGRLGAARYLSDGTGQILIHPRKDTAAVMSADGKSLTPYDYDPFGAEEFPDDAGATSDTGYDLADNPFRFAGEYRDPDWGGYYLRARWYHPDLPSFISRDTSQNLNRFAYAGGNALMHVDPSGHNFFHSLLHGLQEVNSYLNRGVGGGFARFFLAPIMGPLALFSMPASFWEDPSAARTEMFVFLAIGAVSEIFGGYFDSQAVSGVVALSRAARYGRREISDLILGVGQSVASGASNGFNQFSWKNFGEGLEMTGGVAMVTRGLGGVNVRSGYQSGTAVLPLLDEVNNALPGDRTLIFRVKAELPKSLRLLKALPIPRDAPLFDALGLNIYHERIVAVDRFDYSRDVTYSTEVLQQGLKRWHGTNTMSELESGFKSSPNKYMLVGSHAKSVDLNAPYSNPRDVKLYAGVDNPRAPTTNWAGGGARSYRVLWNNCHYHAYYILKNLGLR